MSRAHLRGQLTGSFLLVGATACGPPPGPVVGVTGGVCLFAAHPLALSEEGDAGRVALRGELRIPADSREPSRVRMWLSGHGSVDVRGLTFGADSVRPGRYELVTSADGLGTRFDTISVPAPSDSMLIVSLAPRPSTAPCGYTEVRENPRRPWWQFWRRLN